MIKIVLRDDVDDLGKKGDIVEVRDGFARNYLVPRGLAIPATRGIVKQAEAMRRNREVREAREREAAQSLAARLTGATIAVPARAGEGGKLFGSVTSSDIASAVLRQLEIEVDRRKIDLAEPLKELGRTEVAVKLHTDVTAHLSVEVVAGS